AEVLVPSAPRALVALRRLSAPGWTPERQRAFIEHLAQQGSVNLAADHVGLSRQSAYQLRNRMPNSVFSLAWDTAMMLARRAMLDLAIDRAINGTEVAVRWRGQEVGTRVEYDTRMLLGALRHQPAPIHPNLSDVELHQLFPAMLEDIDAILPPVLSDAEVRARLEDWSENGNDDA
ncbi:hypothetical protein Q5H94_19425, partial [Sphingomonas sp. CA1-15]|nr:hypothetical protein [Sphingomonas sp. CA1-15]